MSASYFKATWHHSCPDDPCLFYSELDEQRTERRKIEINADGRRGFADGQEEVGGARLGEVAVPSVAEINADPEFEASEIEEAEFERLWDVRRTAARRGKKDVLEGIPSSSAAAPFEALLARNPPRVAAAKAAPAGADPVAPAATSPADKPE